MLSKSRGICITLLLAILSIAACVPNASVQSSSSETAFMSKKNIDTSRGTFAYRTSGTSSATPVVMIHGWPENSFTWDRVAANLNTSLRVIAPDLRGLGDSPRTLTVSSYTKLELAKDVVAMLDAMGIKDFFLVGHDWGGAVAQHIAFLYPNRVKKLVIINFPILTNVKGSQAVRGYLNTIGYRPYWYQYFQQQENLPEAMIKGNEDIWVKHFYGTQGVDGTIPAADINEFIRCYKIANTPATAANYYRAMRGDYKNWAALSGKFAMPGLYIYGNKDTVIIKENTQNLEDSFHSITLKELATGHFVMGEKPKEVATMLNDFLH